LVGTAVGRAGSSTGRTGKTIVGAGFEGSFVPCADAGPGKVKMQKMAIKNNPARAVRRPSVPGYLIELDSRGPICFLQKRNRFNGQTLQYLQIWT
jgi:hypothetical protein